MSWKDNLRDVEPYVAGEQPQSDNLIKLNTNENPYGPGLKVKEVIKNFDSQTLSLYPSSDCDDLRKALADYHGLKEDQVFIGNGSDEVLALTFLTCFNSKKPLLFPDITYSFYPVFCDLYRIPFKTVFLDDSFKINKEDYFIDNGGIIFPNPNAPTGALVSVDFIDDLVAHNQGSIVVIDEAYIDFGGQSAVYLLSKYDNLLIIQTFSKFRALAGMRLGVALGNHDIIARLYDVKNSFNSYPVDRLAQAVGLASIQDSETIKDNARKIMATRERISHELKALGFEMTNSYANFIFVRHPDFSGEYLFKALREKNIVVRWFNDERTKDYLRITIGLDKEMDKLVDVLKKIIKQ